MKRTLLFALACSFSLAALAQGSLEAIPLKHRSAEEVIPILRPLLEAGGVLSGQGYQLFVRTTPRNLADLRRTLLAIDMPQRRLLVLVRFDSGVETSGAGFEARVTSSRSASGERVDQRVQVLDGGRAFISTGQSRPVQQQQVFSGPGGTRIQQTTVMQNAESGFSVVPRLSGETVFLEISPQRETFDPGQPGAPAALQSQRVSSRVSAGLGEWVELGGVFESASGSERGVLSSRGAGSSASRRVWVKVEALQP